MYTCIKGTSKLHRLKDLDLVSIVEMHTIGGTAPFFKVSVSERVSADFLPMLVYLKGNLVRSTSLTGSCLIKKKMDVL